MGYFDTIKYIIQKKWKENETAVMRYLDEKTLGDRNNGWGEEG